MWKKKSRSVIYTKILVIKRIDEGVLKSITPYPYKCSAYLCTAAEISDQN